MEFLSRDYGIAPAAATSISRNMSASTAGMPRVSPFPKVNFRGRARIEIALSRWANAVKISRSSYDLFHPTYYSRQLLLHPPETGFVITVFDMTHERYSETFFSADSETSEWKKALVEKANRVIAISNSTKRDLVELFDVPNDKVDVVYVGVRNPAETTAQDDAAEIEIEPYLLYVGLRFGYKNFPLCLGALKKLSAVEPRLVLLCVGGGRFTDTENKLITQHGLSGKVRQVAASDKELTALYKKAKAYLYPSLLEGFGIPVLEALMCDCPVVLSDIPVFHEVAGRAACYFDPRSEESLVDTLRLVLGDRGLRSAKAVEGKKRVGLFSWERCALETAEVYRKAITG